MWGQQTDAGRDRSQLSLSYRRERFVDESSARGWFAGLYSNQNDSSGLVDGETIGFGVNAGICGGDLLNNGVYLDYYLGAATGRHRFDPDFARSIGTTNADGAYTCVAGFAGAALSGDLELGQVTLEPRIGVQYTCAPESDVDLAVSLGAVEQLASFDLNSVSGRQFFLEVREEHLINNGQSLFAFTPRLSC